MRNIAKQHFEQLCDQYKITHNNLVSQLRLNDVFTDTVPFQVKIARSVYAHKVYDQMIELQELANNNNIQVLFFKGLIEAADLYSSVYDRQFTDIDMLISPRDALEFLMLCKKQGYRFMDREITEEDIKQHIQLNSLYHFPPIVKKQTADSIPIEIHLAFDTLWYMDHTLTECMMKNAKILNIEGYDFNTLGLEDRMIILLHHFSRHLLGEFGAIVYSNNKQIYQVKTLYDAVLMYEKYREIINYSKLISLTERYGFKYELLVAIKAINLFFGIDLCELNQISELPIPTNRYWPNIIYNSMLSHMSIELLIEPESKRFYQAVIEECLNNSISYVCRRRYTKSDQILIDEYTESDTKKRFGTVCRCGLVPASSRDCSANASLKWDDSALYFDIEVCAETVQFYDMNNLDAIGSTVALVLYNPMFNEWSDSVLGIHIVPVIAESGDMFVRFEYCGEWDDPKVQRGGTIPGFDKIDYKIDVTETGFRISAKFEWHLLSVNKSKTDFLGMELIINHAKPKASYLNTIMAWANVMPNYYSPEKFGKLIFVE